LFFACSVISPSDGAEDGRPKPRKSSEASDPIVPVTMNGSEGQRRHHRVGQEVAEHDRHVGHAQRPRRAHVFEVARAQELRAHHARTRPIQPNSTIRNTSSQKFIWKIADMMMIT
jgi:hypothetical protein